MLMRRVTTQARELVVVRRDHHDSNNPDGPILNVDITPLATAIGAGQLA
jgi:hypothetical protein